MFLLTDPEVVTGVTTTEITNVLSLFGAVADFVLEKISDVVDVVMANPLLLIPIGIVTLYTIISVFKKLF